MATEGRLPVAMKRRVVYMDDATWENLRAVAKGQGVTMSEVLRRAGSAPFTHLVTQPEHGPQQKPEKPSLTKMLTTRAEDEGPF